MVSVFGIIFKNFPLLKLHTLLPAIAFIIFTTSYFIYTYVFNEGKFLYGMR